MELPFICVSRGDEGEENVPRDKQQTGFQDNTLIVFESKLISDR